MLYRLIYLRTTMGIDEQPLLPSVISSANGDQHKIDSPRETHSGFASCLGKLSRQEKLIWSLLLVNLILLYIAATATLNWAPSTHSRDSQSCLLRREALPYCNLDPSLLFLEKLLTS